MIDLLDTRPFATRREQTLFKTLRDTAPVHFNPEPDGPGFWNLTRHDDVSMAARDTKRFLSGKGTQIRDKRAEGHGHASVHNADGGLHSQLRTPALAALSRTAMVRHAERIAQIVDRLIALAPRGEAFDFVEAVAKQLPMIVIAEVLGVPGRDAAQLTAWANAMSDVNASDAEQAACRASLFGYFRALAADKRHQTADDVASALVGHFGGPDAAGILDAYFMLLTVAGNETTRFLLAEGLEALVQTPGALTHLRADPALAASAVEEMCRLVSPVMQMRRTLAEDMTLHGIRMPAGAKVVLWFVSANHDERAFADPGRFDIARSPNRHLGFGQGPHFCLGAHLARLEVRLFLEAMLRDISAIEIMAPAERAPSNWFVATQRLMVRWQ